MAVLPAEFAAGLLKEAQETHPLFRMIYDGQLTRVQLRDVIRQQGCFFLDTLRHAAWKIISVGGYTPTFEDLERQRALIPLVVEEGGEDTVGGKTTAHAYLFIRLAEALGIARDQLFSTEYLPTTIIEKNELFLLQRSSTLEALCGGNIATESINPEHMQRMSRRDGEALRRGPRRARLLPGPRRGRGRSRRARGPHPLEAGRHRRGAGARPPRPAPGDHRAADLRRRDAGGLRRPLRPIAGPRSACA